MYRFYVALGDYRQAREVTEQCLRLAERLDDPELFLEAHRGLGLTSFFLGAFAAPAAPTVSTRWPSTTRSSIARMPAVWR